MRDYEPDIDRILELYAQLEDDIISSMVRRIMKMGFVSESTRYEAELLQAAGLLYDDIIVLIAQRTDATTEAVAELFREAGVQTVSIDNEVYREAGEVPIDIRQDEGMRQILEAGYRKTNGTMRNLVSTTAGQSEQAFIQACDRAYMQVSSGAFSYQTAIMQAVRGFADIGAMVQYPSGHRDHLDVAVRRAVLTGVGQTSAAVSREHAEKMGCHLMELTAHSGARPDHAAWQGQLVTLTGEDAGNTIDGLRVWTLNEIGYGTGAGFKGWNCRHNWHPYYVGYSTPNYTPEQIAALNERNIEYNGAKYTEYEISQMQRAAERKIRKYKRRVVAEQTLMDNAPDDASRAAAEIRYQREAAKLKAAEKELNDFCKQTGRYKDTFRTQVDGFGRSEAQRTVWANKKRLTNGGSNGTIEPQGKIKWLKKGKELTSEQKRELTYYAASKNIVLKGLNRTDVDIGLMHEVLDEAEKVLRLHPELNSNPDAPFTIKVVNGMDANDFAMTTKTKGRNIIQLNANAFRNKTKLAKEYQKLVDERWFVQGTTYRSVIAHEIGHIYSNYHKINSLEIAKKILGLDGNSKVLEEMQERLSKYAKTQFD